MRPIVLEVEEHDEIPDGCYQRFSALDEPQPIQRLHYEGAERTVEALDADGTRRPATRVLVDDSSGGQSVLVYGGTHGLRLTDASGIEVAEPYLLLAPDELPGDTP